MSEPTIAEIVREALDSRLNDVHVALPGRVEKYDASTQTADVLPMVRRAITDTDGNTQHEELPVIPNVLVHFPRSAGFHMVWPLSQGDFVTLLFNSSAIGNWRETGDIADPGDLRRHDLSYPVAIPGAAPKGDVLPAATTSVRLDVTAPTTHIQVGSDVDAKFVALENLVALRFTELVTAINAAIIAVGAGGAADVGVKLIAAGWASMPVPPTVAATKLKSE